MDQQEALSIAQDQIIKVMDHYGAPPEIYPKEVGIRPGRTSVYVWDFQSSYPSEENGNIYLSSKLLDMDDVPLIQKVSTHEAIHLLQEKMMGRDMTQRVQSEAEAEAMAIKFVNGQPAEFGVRQKPVQDLWYIKNTPVQASTCWLGESGEVIGIQAAPNCECATFSISPDESFRVLRLLGIIR